MRSSYSQNYLAQLKKKSIFQPQSHNGTYHSYPLTSQCDKVQGVERRAHSWDHLHLEHPSVRGRKTWSLTHGMGCVTNPLILCTGKSYDSYSQRPTLTLDYSCKVQTFACMHTITIVTCIIQYILTNKNAL